MYKAVAYIPTTTFILLLAFLQRPGWQSRRLTSSLLRILLCTASCLQCMLTPMRVYIKMHTQSGRAHNTERIYKIMSREMSRYNIMESPDRMRLAYQTIYDSTIDSTKWHLFRARSTKSPPDIGLAVSELHRTLVPSPHQCCTLKTTTKKN